MRDSDGVALALFGGLDSLALRDVLALNGDVLDRLRYEESRPRSTDHGHKFAVQARSCCRPFSVGERRTLLRVEV